MMTLNFVFPAAYYTILIASRPPDDMALQPHVLTCTEGVALSEADIHSRVVGI